MLDTLLGSTSSSGSQQMEEMYSSCGFYLYIFTTFNKMHSPCQARALQLCFKVATYYFKIGKGPCRIGTKNIILPVVVFWNNYLYNYLVFSLKVFFSLILNCGHNQVLLVRRLKFKIQKGPSSGLQTSSLLKMSTVFQTLVVSDQTVLPSQRDVVSTLWLQPADPGLLSGITQDNSVR